MIGNEEPSATSRQAARAMRDMFSALVAEGFSEAQSLTIIGQYLTATVISQRSAE